MGVGTFSQIYVQIVFAVKGRKSAIHPSWEEELFKYITGIVQGKEQKMIRINGMPDHIHMLVGIRPSCRISDLVREVKKASNAFINRKKFCRQKFEWQEGYGAFSYSHSALENVIAYIDNQKEHHRKKTFKEEYKGFLKKFNIVHNDDYLFE